MQHMQKFQATFAVRSQYDGAACFLFNGTDHNDYDLIRVHFTSTSRLPDAAKVENGWVDQNVSSTATPANMPALVLNSSVLWVRIVNDGTTVKVLCQASATEPASWSEGSHKVLETSNFQNVGGRIGFRTQGYCWVDDLKVYSRNESTGAYDTLEHLERFNVDSVTKRAADVPVYDRAGNLTYDGVRRLEYDAWNRLVAVRHAFRDDGGDVQAGRAWLTMRYDGRGRRIVKNIDGTGQLDCQLPLLL